VVLLAQACAAGQPLTLPSSLCPSDLLCPTTLPLPQIYDYIDRHITKLDKDCKAFDAGKPATQPAPSPASLA
jgi:hypothetical protein